MKAKRLISGVCALAISSTAIAAGFSVSAAGEDVVLKGQHIEGSAGAEFELTVDIAELNGDAAKGFSGCEFAIEYDPAQIEITGLTQGKALDTGATSEELKKAPSIGDEVTMIGNKGDYNCFDYNIVSKDDKTVVAVLWCTGLDSSEYWAKEAGTLFTINGTVSENAKAGDEIPVNIVPIDRDGNKDIIFGYIDGTIDKTYTASVAEQGLITIKDNGTELTPLWGDVNNNGSVTASDIVAMIKFILDPEEAGLTEQGICNGNLYQGDNNTDLTSDNVLNVQDLILLKKYVLGDISESSFPMMKLK